VPQLDAKKDKEGDAKGKSAAEKPKKDEEDEAVVSVSWSLSRRLTRRF
jgi:hypothetical protein